MAQSVLRRLVWLATVAVAVSYAANTATTAMSTTLATRSASQSINHLRVSMGPIAEAPSARPSVGQLELLNVHATESVEIISVSTTEEETRPLNQQPLPTPPQFHVSRLPDSLRLEPGQVAVVPVTLLPRFPSGDKNERYEVRTTVEVQTNQGHVTLPIRATTRRSNDYDLPDTILLETPRDINTDESTWELGDSAASCQPLRLRASSNPLTITQISTVEAPYVSLSNESNEERRLLVSWDNRHATQDRNELENRSLLIPVDGELHTIARVCLHTNEVDDADYQVPNDPWMHFGQYQSLGVLQILTTRETLFVQLEKTLVGVDSQQGTPVSEYQPHDVSLTPIPAHMSLVFMHAENDLIEKTIRVYVPRSSPSLRLMRASTILDSEKRDRDHGLHVRVQPHASVDMEPMNVEGETDGLVLLDTVSLQVSLNWDVLHARFGESRDSISFQGKVEIRATTGNDDFKTWSRKVQENPSLDANLTLAIPIDTTIVRSKVGFASHSSTHTIERLAAHEKWSDGRHSVSALFFPASMDHALELARRESPVEALPEDEYIDHRVHVFTNVLGGGIQMEQINVLVAEGTSGFSLCHRFDVTVAREPGNYGDYNGENTTDLGILRLRYVYDSDQEQNQLLSMSDDVPPTMCQLQIRTKPDTGSHTLPLIIYSGRVNVTAGKYEARESNSLQASGADPWHRALVGFEPVLDWFQTSDSGRALRELLLAAGEGLEDDASTLRGYMNKLSHMGKGEEFSKLRPVLLKVEAVQHDDVVTLPLYLTNHNPVPLTVSVEVGEVEGMSISLGRDESGGWKDGNRITDFLAGPVGLRNTGEEREEPIFESGPYKGHATNGIRQFLLSGKVFDDFFSRFAYKDAISVSEVACSKLPLLRHLYNSKASSQFHRSGTPRRLQQGVFSESCNVSTHPSFYGSFSHRLADSTEPGPLLVAGDSSSHRYLQTCWGSAVNRTLDDEGRIKIPPGGIARFEINLRSPPTRVLKHDISPFVGTGLVLSTDHGEVLPVFVSFEALQGTLHVSHFSSSVLNQDAQRRDGVIRVPPKLFAKIPKSSADKIRVPAHNPPSQWDTRGVSVVLNNVFDDGSVPLFMKSNFLRDVNVLEIASCNPWFHVSLNESQVEKIHPVAGVQVGHITSTVTCDQARLDSSNYSSFYSCATNWIVNRDQLQREGCGGIPLRKNAVDSIPSPVEKTESERLGVTKATEDMREAMRIMESIYEHSREFSVNATSTTKSEGGSNDGRTTSILIDAVSNAWRAWVSLSVDGVRELSTSLRAIVEYNSSEPALSSESNRQPPSRLAVPLKNLTIVTTLAMPVLFDERQARKTSPFSRSGNFDDPSVIEFAPTKLGGTTSLYIPLKNPTPVPVKVRLTVAGLVQGATASANGGDNSEKARWQFLGNFPSPYVQGASQKESNNSWWEGTSAYFISNLHSEVVRSGETLSSKATGGGAEVLFAPSMSARTAFSIGCGLPCGVRVSPLRTLEEENGSPSIGASSSNQEALTSRSRSYVISDAPNKPASDTDTLKDDQNFAIPPAALNEIVLPPFGEGQLGPLFFRPMTLPDCRKTSQREGGEVCLPPRLQSLVLLENSLTGLERILLSGKVNRERLVFQDFPTEDGLGHMELRHGHAAMLFNDMKCITDTCDPFVRRFSIHNDGEARVSISRVGVSNPNSPRSSPTTQECSYGEFTLLSCPTDTFTLGAGESFDFSVEFRPACISTSFFVAVDFETSGSNKQRERILVGYDYQPDECVPFQESISQTTISLRIMFEKGAKTLYSLATMFLLTCTLLVFSGCFFDRRGQALRFNSHMQQVNPRDLNRVLSFGWYPTFRCLARSEPSSDDMLSLGREQSRHLLLARYKSCGLLPPTCISSMGVFHRDRGDTEGSRTRKMERNRVLSNTIFKTFSSRVYANVSLPANIRWQAVSSRIVSLPQMLAKIRRISMSDTLLTKRGVQADDCDAPNMSGSFSEQEGEIVDAEPKLDDDVSVASFSNTSRTEDPTNALQSIAHATAVTTVVATSVPSETLVSSKVASPGIKAPPKSEQPSKPLLGLEIQRSSSASLESATPERVRPIEFRSDGYATHVTPLKSVVKEQPMYSQPKHLHAPPGLAPPPGFGTPTLSPSKTASLGMPSYPAALSGDNNQKQVTESMNQSFSGEINPSGFSMLENDGVLQPACADSFDGHSSSGEFDIMDFLDGILNDGSSQSADEEEIKLVTDNPHPHPKSALHVSSNPWAEQLGGMSRAAAYGISFDETHDNRSSAVEPENSMQVVPPDTEAVLGSDSERQKNSSMSFFANLQGD